MKLVGAGLCLSYLLGTALSAAEPATRDFARLRRQGYDLFQQGRFLEAAELNRRGFASASAQGDHAAALRFLGNLGACQLATFDHRSAMSAFTQVLEQARATGDSEMIATAMANIATIHVMLGEPRRALVLAEQAFATRRANPHPHWDQMLLHLAWIYARNGEMQRAIPYFVEGIEAADRRGDSYYQAKGWDRLGYELLQRGDLAAAERSLSEAFRIRKMTRSAELHLSYPKLGMLRLAQGDLRSAAVLMDLAVSSGREAAGLTVLCQVYHDRGLVRLAQGRPRAAWDDFGTALEYARRWRAGVLPVESLQASTEVSLSQIYAAFIRTGNRLYLEARSPALARTTLEAAEESRLASLRAMIHTPESWRQRLPAAYWETLARLHAAEVKLLRTGDPATRRELDRLRLELTDAEARAGLQAEWRAAPAQGGSVASAQRALAPDETLFSFRLDEPQSWVWAMTANALELYALPSRKQIAAEVRRLRQAVMAGAPDARPLGQNLYNQLFGEIAPRFRTKTNWTLVLDDTLFELPFAALVPPAGGGGSYLVEHHALRVLPSALMAARPARESGPFVGIGDPVYNIADPRWGGARKPVRGSELELPRLAGSRREIEGCAGILRERRFETVLLRGADASRDRIEQALDSAPAVLHFATHVLSSAHHPAQALIALSLRSPEAHPEFLSTLEISALRSNLGLVVLSGCSSGMGQALPGAGLMGLTRAWTLAGARSVLASLWPTPDDSGELFQSFYSRLARAQRQPEAQLLQAAQREMIRARGWRSLPRYWSAYFIVGRG